MDYSFHFYNGMAGTGIMMALNHQLLPKKSAPVVLGIGSDLAIGDSLGPLVGTLLKRSGDFHGYVYGTLKNPVTAKEVKYLNDFVRKTHPTAPVIAVDAAVGEETDIGLIKVTGGSLRPGSGANKKLGKVGDASVLGIVAGKSAFSYELLNLTRLNMVYSMAEAIAEAIIAYGMQERGAIVSKLANG